MMDSKDIEIRRATLNDTDKIEVLLQELIGNPLNDRRRFYDHAFSSEDYVGLVAEKEGDIIGYVDLWGFPDPGHGALLGVILNFIVSKEHRKLGVGDSLLKEAVRIAEKRNFREFHVWTEFTNEAAISLYKKHGFTNESLVLERESD